MPRWIGMCGVTGCENPATHHGRLSSISRDDRPAPANVSDNARVDFLLCEDCVPRMAGKLSIYHRAAADDPPTRRLALAL